ncbi:hypothetical protein [White spot syndrome virus]|uniref:Uncharacterized protein n=1 Tax=White spot syndrome virus TaxID=342409 RepID=A0A2R2XEX9_9VIRU|nr:hypothetical protein [White spot syndrome virus]
MEVFSSMEENSQKKKKKQWVSIQIMEDLFGRMVFFLNMAKNKIWYIKYVLFYCFFKK